MVVSNLSKIVRSGRKSVRNFNNKSAYFETCTFFGLVQLLTKRAHGWVRRDETSKNMGGGFGGFFVGDGCSMCCREIRENGEKERERERDETE